MEYIEIYSLTQIAAGLGISLLTILIPLIVVLL